MENKIAIRTAIYIIKKEVNKNIFNKIINVINLQNIWERLKIICFQLRQRILYLIL